MGYVIVYLFGLFDAKLNDIVENSRFNSKKSILEIYRIKNSLIIQR